jgi:hypothetical protein
MIYLPFFLQVIFYHRYILGRESNKDNYYNKKNLNIGFFYCIIGLAIISFRPVNFRKNIPDNFVKNFINHWNSLLAGVHGNYYCQAS